MAPSFCRYFGRKASGEVAELEQLTYAEVLLRMVALMFVPPHELRPDAGWRWLHSTYASRVFAFLRRTAERFATPTLLSCLRNSAGAEEFLEAGFARSGADSGSGSGSDGGLGVSCVEDLGAQPVERIQRFLDRLPRARTTLLAEEDVDFFLHLCATGGKPVPFVPVVDAGLEGWFKKDSLW